MVMINPMFASFVNRSGKSKPLAQTGAGGGMGRVLVGLPVRTVIKRGTLKKGKVETDYSLGESPGATPTELPKLASRCGTPHVTYLGDRPEPKTNRLFCKKNEAHPTKLNGDGSEHKESNGESYSTGKVKIQSSWSDGLEATAFSRMTNHECWLRRDNTVSDKGVFERHTCRSDRSALLEELIGATNAAYALNGNWPWLIVDDEHTGI